MELIPRAELKTLPPIQFERLVRAVRAESRRRLKASRKKLSERAAEMARRYEAGESFGMIAPDFKISRQRAAVIITRELSRKEKTQCVP